MKRIYITLMAALTAVMSFAQTAVTPPSGATIESYTLSNALYLYVLDEDAGEQDYTIYQGFEKQIAFDGTDVYIQGLSLFLPNGWVKGTINSAGNQIVVATGQYVGSFETSDQTIPFYIVGMSEESSTETDCRDIVFDYDAANNTLTLNSNYYIMESLDAAALNMYVGYWTKLTLQKAIVENPVEAPEDLTTEEYVFKGSRWLWDSDGNYTGSEAVAYAVNVGFYGSNEVYIQGLCEAFPEAWVKGTIDDDEVTIESGQYLGKSPYGSVYLCGYSYGALGDLVLIYDKDTKTFSGNGSYMAINSSKTDYNPYDVFAGFTISKVTEKVATPANPSISHFEPYNDTEGYGYLLADIPVVDTDGEGMVTDKLSYQVYYDIDGTVSVYTFDQNLYRDIPETSMTEIPYDYADNYDIFKGGSQICFYDDWKAFKRVGIQSIYRGGDVERRSDIVWVSTDTDGISLKANDSEVASERYTDLQGRSVSADTKGLVIRQQRMADGSVKTTKMVRR